MCVISLVMDHFDPLFPKIDPSPTTWTVTPVEDINVEELKKLIQDFKEAVEAAKKVDALTGQRDCVDPEKAKLEERVARLEKIIDRLLEAKP